MLFRGIIIISSLKSVMRIEITTIENTTTTESSNFINVVGVSGRIWPDVRVDNRQRWVTRTNPIPSIFSIRGTETTEMEFGTINTYVITEGGSRSPTRVKRCAAVECLIFLLPNVICSSLAKPKYRWGCATVHDVAPRDAYVFWWVVVVLLFHT